MAIENFPESFLHNKEIYEWCHLSESFFERFV